MFEKKLELKLENEDFDETGVDRERGKRAEEVTEWYFRLNGFFLIPGFIVHPDRHKSSFAKNTMRHCLA